MIGHGIDALPYGSFSTGPGGRRRIGVRLGDVVLDLTAVAGRLRAPWAEVVAGPTLNPLLAAGPEVWPHVRATARRVLEAGPADEELLPVEAVTMHLPFDVADYVDFYSSEHHAAAVGRLFRPDAEPLLPNWKHLPVGYHGRAGTVVVSGTPVRRPAGQLGPGRFGPTERLDLEAEVGFVVGAPSELGRPVPGNALRQHVFGVVLLNDWSARDVQSWETRPLGPLLGKSFATSISAWVLPLEALEHARVAPPRRDVPLPPYLAEADAEPWGLDIELTVEVNDCVVSRPPFASMYWTPAQQLAHLTVNGASLRTGDLFASGTVSGPEPGEPGSLLELSENGRRPFPVKDGERTFLEDGDEVVLTATAPGPHGTTVALGEVRGRISP